MFTARTGFAERGALPAQQGLYALVWRDGGGNDWLLYIGSSGNLRRRWKKHEVMKYFLSDADLWIEYTTIETDQRTLRQMEAQLIRSESPPLNVAVNTRAKERLIRFALHTLEQAGVIRANLADTLRRKRANWKASARACAGRRGRTVVANRRSPGNIQQQVKA